MKQLDELELEDFNEPPELASAALQDVVAVTSVTVEVPILVSPSIV